MKKFIYMGLLTVCLTLKTSWGSEEGEISWDNDKIARIAVDLRNNPSRLIDFLDIVAKQKKEEVSSYALTPVLWNQQITLKAQDIIEATDISQNFQKVFYVDLNDYNFISDDKNRQKIFSYFNDNTLDNLRVIKVCKTTGISNLIGELFGSSKPKNKYVSLFRIAADGSDITSQDLDKIYSYFSRCSYFIRDMVQISARYDVVAAFLSVELREVNTLGNIDGWRRGKKTPSSEYLVLYRSQESDIRGPFIMSVEG